MTLSNSQISNALNKVDPAIAQLLKESIKDLSFSGRIIDSNLECAEQLLPLAKAFSIHPISGFAVGAVAVGQSGNLYLGANIEFLGVPLHATIHAEQSALLNARMHQENKIVALYVSELPCGHCRQFLRELSNINRLKIFVHGHAYSLETLLPNAFGEAPTKGLGLLDTRNTKLEIERAQLNASTKCAIDAAERSYTPYSHSPEGFFIQCTDGRIFVGSIAECAAFNPSVPSVIVALNQRNFSTSRDVPINKAIQVKVATSINDSLAFAQSVINSISDCEVECVCVGVR